MEKDNSKRFESVFTERVKAGKRRTYFFDVRKTKGEDFYLTLTESTRRFNGEGYERHKIFLYKEDFNRFLTSLTKTIDFVKTELMPDYDYDEFTRRNEEYEANKLKEAQEAAAQAEKEAESTPEPEAETETESADDSSSESSDAPADNDEIEEEDMSW